MLKNIHEIIPFTIQGEGLLTGTPVSFVRLFGCPVGCDFCDTGYAKQQRHKQKHIPRYQLPFYDLGNQLACPDVVISGGEPFIHPQLPELVDTLLYKFGKNVYIETSGSTDKHDLVEDPFNGAHITLSPKVHVTGNPRHMPSAQWWKHADEIKIVIRKKGDLDLYWNFLDAVLDANQQFDDQDWYTEVPTYLQPEFNTMEESLEVIYAYMRNCPDYKFKLSCQTHKFIGVA